eukprot:evm.model.NODE_44893_length_9735_cov_35.126759.3
MEPTTCLDTVRVIEVLRQSMSTVDGGCARVNLQNKDAATHPEIEANDKRAGVFRGSAHTDILDLSFITHHAACTAVVTAWIENFNPEKFLTMLGKVAHAGVHLDAVDLAMTNVHSTKGTDLAGSMNETGLSTVLVNGAAVGASKKEKATIASKVNIWALPKIAAGKEALVAVANFYQAQPVTMSLTSKCVLGIEMT